MKSEETEEANADAVNAETQLLFLNQVKSKHLMLLTLKVILEQDTE
ncbi:hypothetical protein O9929_20060 [Vibrio lentus]|nr:hypothetical protein [Vibrio lentus]